MDLHFLDTENWSPAHDINSIFLNLEDLLLKPDTNYSTLAKFHRCEQYNKSKNFMDIEIQENGGAIRSQLGGFGEFKRSSPFSIDCSEFDDMEGFAMGDNVFQPGKFKRIR
jgi:hypothetical protein